MHGPRRRHRQQHHRDQGDRLGPAGPRRRRGPGRRADARPRPRPVRAERPRLVALARRGAGRPVPAGRPGARRRARDQQPARDRGLPRRRRRGAPPGDPVARRALPRRHRPVRPRSSAAERFRAITGKTPDPTPAVFSLHWLRRCEPRRWRRLAHAVDVHGYLVWRLTGARRDELGQRRPARRPRPAGQALQPRDPGGPGHRRRAVLPRGAAGHA